MTQTPHCIEHSTECSGEVEYHLNPDRDDLKAFARCEHHQAKRLAFAERRAFSAISDVPPAGFDPADAGERWDEDD